MQKIEQEDKIVIFIGIFLILCLILFLTFYLVDIMNPLEKYEYFPTVYDEKILVIAPHPDDEVAMAGSFLITIPPDQMSILYLTDGSYFQNEFIHRVYSRQRIREAENAMNSLGITNIRFLHLTDQQMFFNSAQLRTAYNEIEYQIIRDSPDIIIVPAYEGGHCIHDITNYIVSNVVEGIDFKGKIYEVPLYNDYYSLDTPRKLVSKILFYNRIRLDYPALFLPDRIQKQSNQIYIAATDKDILKERQRVLEIYKSQNIEGSLTKKFGYSELLRELPDYDYNVIPYERKASLDYYECIAKNPFNKSRCERISVCQVTFEDYNNAMVMINESRI